MDQPAQYLERIVAFALVEDLGAGDVTSKATVSQTKSGHARIVARQDGVLSGMEVVNAVFTHIGDVDTTWRTEDGERLTSGQTVAELSGPARRLLAGERVALNFLARMSGIATLTRQFVEGVGGHQARILDTRKTTPGLRHLEKYAVRCGGGENHRFGLYDMILVKENHIQAAGGLLPAIKAALNQSAKTLPRIPVEIETQTVKEAALAASLMVDRIMLDNMPVAQMREAVLRVRDICKETGKFVGIEASGNVTLENIHAVAETGVDFISIGALTHSAPAFDFSMLFT
jgi:nicotinate-nucleotide pyrophosphorylase (carboxylating)